MNRIKILLCGFSLNTNQGLAYLSVSLLKKFYQKEFFDLAYATIAGPNTDISCVKIWGEDFVETAKKVKYYNTQLLDPATVLTFDNAVKEFKPNIVITLLDPWMLDQISYSVYRNTFFLVNYLTIETPEYPNFVMMPTQILPNPRKSIKNMLQASDLLIPVTKMGQKNLKSYGFEHVTENVYPGLDLEKIIKEPISKQSVFGNSLKEDDFIFMCMAVNNERKKIDRTLEAFAKFLYKKQSNANKYKLYLQCNVDQAGGGGTDLRELIHQLKINNNVLLLASYEQNVGLSKLDVYMKYKASDCFILLTGGEGFGYGYAEAIAHGKPVIYSNYGGHVEFCKDFGLPVSIKDFSYAAGAGIKFAIADTDHAADKMVQIVSDQKFRKKVEETGFEFCSSQFNWDKNFEVFYKLVFDNFKIWNSKANHNLPMKRII